MKKLFKGLIIVVGAIVLLLILIASCSKDTPTSDDQSSSQQNEDGKKTESTEKPEEKPKESSSEQIGEGDAGDYHIIIGDAVLSEDYEGNSAVIVDFIWTNNSDDATSFAVATTAKCFQDGVQCDSATISGADHLLDSMKEIKNGATQELKQAYKIDPSKPFEIEVEEFITLTDTGLVKKVFDALG